MAHAMNNELDVDVRSMLAEAAGMEDTAPLQMLIFGTLGELRRLKALEDTMNAAAHEMVNVSNKSGITPVGDRIVVKPDSIEEKTEGGIIIPGTVGDQHMLAQSIGTLIAVGPDAFSEYTTISERYIDDKWRPFERSKTGFSKDFAEPGDRICFAKFAGLQVEGKDGEVYRLLNDTDITAVVEEGVNFTDIKSRQSFGAGQ